MLRFILRRLGWSVLTIFGVMLITFLLFRVVAGDIAASNVGVRATEQEKAKWEHLHGYDLPPVFNVHQRLTLKDNTEGKGTFDARAPKDSGSNVANALALVMASAPTPKVIESDEDAAAQAEAPGNRELAGRYIWRLSEKTPLSAVIKGSPLTDRPSPKAPQPKPLLEFELTDGSTFTVDLSKAATVGDLLHAINDHPGNKGIKAEISPYDYHSLLDSQFFHHLYDSALFQGLSFRDNRKLTSIIAEKAPYSLAIQVPALAFEFILGLAIAAVVAYYRGRAVDKVGVFLSVLGMCVPFLAFMIYGQYLMFLIAPRHAYGIFDRVNIYLPVSIMVVAGLGGTVRFYRTIILDETTRDYVRTAKAKGLPLPTILFKHVLRNCMLPIMTNLILTIPFLIMGSLLVESYFGIPGLGDLMITSISNRNEPIMSGMVFLTAVIYTVGVLLTDISYAIFDPRIRLN